jgi:hypothetical protein
MHYLFEGQFTLHNFCPKPGFLRVVTVVKIESRSFSTAEIQLKIGRVIIYRQYVWFKCGLQVKTIIIWLMRKLQPYMETWLKTAACNVFTTWIVLCNWRCVWLHDQIKTYQMPLWERWGKPARVPKLAWFVWNFAFVIMSYFISYGVYMETELASLSGLARLSRLSVIALFTRILIWN